MLVAIIGYAWDKTPGWYEKIWKRWTKVTYETEKPYAYTLGNHDNESDLGRRDIVKLDMTNPHSYTQLCPESVPGASTYVIPVYSSRDENEVVMNLWFFDSGNRGCGGQGHGFGCIERDVVEWYRRRSDELEKEQGERVPAMAFFHIPPQEFMVGWMVCDERK